MVFRYTPRDMYIPLFVPLKDFLLFYFRNIFIWEGSSRVVPYKKYNNTNRGIIHTISISQYKLKNNGIYNKIDNTLNNLQFRYHKNDKNVLYFI